MVSKQLLYEKLGVVLADTYVTLMMTQKLHWHVTGSHFYAIHKMTQHQYEEMVEAIDTIAEHMRAQGAQAPSGMGRYASLTTIQEQDSALSTTDASLEHLIEAHRYIRSSIDKSLRLAQELEDVATEDLLVDRIREHDKHIWMLASSISSV